jgi:hypothetical protein
MAWLAQRKRPSGVRKAMPDDGVFQDHLALLELRAEVLLRDAQRFHHGVLGHGARLRLLFFAARDVDAVGQRKGQHHHFQRRAYQQRVGRQRIATAARRCCAAPA